MYLNRLFVFLQLTRRTKYIVSTYIDITIRSYKKKKKKELDVYIKSIKFFHLAAKRFTVFVRIAIYFSKLSFSRTVMTKSAN